MNRKGLGEGGGKGKYGALTRGYNQTQQPLPPRIWSAKQQKELQRQWRRPENSSQPERRVAVPSLLLEVRQMPWLHLILCLGFLFFF